MNDSFFGKNGTMQGALNLASSIKGAKSNSSKERLGALGRIVSLVMSLFA